MPEINWKIDVGHLLLLVSMLIGGAIGWGNLTAQMSEQARSIASLQMEWRTGHDRLIEQTNGLRDQLDALRVQQMQTKTQLDDRLALGKGR
jgi:hypothetical protein